VTIHDLATAITYPTGRDYGQPQILAIKTTNRDSDGWITAVFEDASRGICGRVEVLAVNIDRLGPEVLAAYDAGFYQVV
jgi:hypothetical protein